MITTASLYKFLRFMIIAEKLFFITEFCLFTRIEMNFINILFAEKKQK